MQNNILQNDMPTFGENFEQTEGWAYVPESSIVIETKASPTSTSGVVAGIASIDITDVFTSQVRSMQKQIATSAQNKQARQAVLYISKTEVQTMPSVFRPEEVNGKSKTQTPQFDTPEEAEDERKWDAQFAATPVDKFRRIVDKIRSDIQAGRVSPLDFTDQ